MDLSKTQKNKRLAMMVSGAFAIFFTGYPHVWSIYQPYVMEQAGWSQGQASMCFYLALCTFVFGNIVGGRMQDKYNPRCTNPEDAAAELPMRISEKPFLLES